MVGAAAPSKPPVFGVDRVGRDETVNRGVDDVEALGYAFVDAWWRPVAPGHELLEQCQLVQLAADD
jgi:hypothetical protein